MLVGFIENQRDADSLLLNNFYLHMTFNMRATKTDIIRFYNMVKDKEIRERLIKNYDEEFNNHIEIKDERPIHRKVYECITEGFSRCNSPQGYTYWDTIAGQVYRNKIELKTLFYDL